MANKAATASIIAAVGVVAVIGTIAAVMTSRKAHGEGAPMATSVRLSELCSSTLYPEKCEKSLSPVVNETSNPEDVFRAALQVALDEVGAVFVRYTDVGKDAADSVTKSAIAECKKLLNDAISDLKDMTGLRADQVLQHVNDLRFWLSSAMTYVYTCADGFDKPELKEAMDKLLQNSTELSSNALAIVTKVGEVLQSQDGYKKIAGGSRRLLGWNNGGDAATTEESRRRLLAVNGRLDEIADVRDASRRLLSETLDEIAEMSHDGSRRLHSFMLTDDDSNANDGSGPEFDVVGRRRLMMSMDASMFSGISNLSKETDLVRRRLMSMSFNDASSESGAEVKYDQDGNKRKLLSFSFQDQSSMTRAEGPDPYESQRRLLSMPFDSASATTGTEVNYAQEGNRRRLLSAQIESIADMSAHINRRLLATELPEDLAGKRQLLSNTLIMVQDVANEANGQLEAIDKGEEDERRVLTTDVIGTIEDLDDHNHQHRTLLSAGAFPQWVPSNARRLLQLPGTQKPNAVVAADGSGNFKTITEAVNAAPKKSTARFVIYVKAGDYKEYVTVPKDLTNIFMYGDGPTKTRVIGDKSNKGGFATIATRTFSSEGNGFICKSMAFVNTAGPDGHQAVAMHAQGDFSVFFNCRFEGYQDTLYVHANRQFFRNCEVLGTIDFIFGNSAALFQNCLMTVRKPMDNQGNMVTAHGRTDKNMPTGLVLQGCKIVPEQALFPVRLTIPSYLGRPWKEYARTVVMESTIGDLIKPEGWSEWMGDLGLSTLYYAEYANTGPGAGTSKRVTWPGYRVIGQAEATHFTAGVFVDGTNGSWVQNSGAPNVMGFIK
ncbi:hypothetical protein QYE76_046587 [Lolium multiflorum]|uniref:pectinesterase n=1 Tax=Lolium multiflorum TaxID=4521 RepID=A0AAD8TQ59_LOLMU|nr:hypothetical protein QYE76_046587 [Lolium multiflorum]